MQPPPLPRHSCQPGLNPHRVRGAKITGKGLKQAKCFISPREDKALHERENKKRIQSSVKTSCKIREQNCPGETQAELGRSMIWAGGMAVSIPGKRRQAWKLKGQRLVSGSFVSACLFFKESGTVGRQDRSRPQKTTNKQCGVQTEVFCSYSGTGTLFLAL